MSSLIQKPVLIAVRFMSITRSSIPVCIHCTALCASCVPPFCVTAAHSSPVPPAIVCDIARLVPLQVALWDPQEQQQPNLPGLCLRPCMQLCEKWLSPSLLNFLFPLCALLTFAFLDSLLPSTIPAGDAFRHCETIALAAVGKSQSDHMASTKMLWTARLLYPDVQGSPGWIWGPSSPAPHRSVMAHHSSTLPSETKCRTMKAPSFRANPTLTIKKVLLPSSFQPTLDTPAL